MNNLPTRRSLTLSLAFSQFLGSFAVKTELSTRHRGGRWPRRARWRAGCPRRAVPCRAGLAHRAPGRSAPHPRRIRPSEADQVVLHCAQHPPVRSQATLPLLVVYGPILSKLLVFTARTRRSRTWSCLSPSLRSRSRRRPPPRSWRPRPTSDQQFGVVLCLCVFGVLAEQGEAAKGKTRRKSVMCMFSSWPMQPAPPAAIGWKRTAGN